LPHWYNRPHSTSSTGRQGPAKACRSTTPYIPGHCQPTGVPSVTSSPCMTDQKRRRKTAPVPGSERRRAEGGGRPTGPLTVVAVLSLMAIYWAIHWPDRVSRLHHYAISEPPILRSSRDCSIDPVRATRTLGGCCSPPFPGPQQRGGYCAAPPRAEAIPPRHQPGLVECVRVALAMADPRCRQSICPAQGGGELEGRHLTSTS
jgi:hypothetical protein